MHASPEGFVACFTLGAISDWSSRNVHLRSGVDVGDVVVMVLVRVCAGMNKT